MSPTPCTRMAALAAGLTVAALFSSATAHMSLSPSEVTPGGRITMGLTISHDCGTDTVGTSNFTIGVPEGMMSIKVEDTPGWHVVINKVTLDPPITMGSTTHNETIRSIEFHGFLQDDYYKTFGIKAQALDTLEVGTELWFSGYQECHGDGTPIAWATIPSEEDANPQRPARAVTVVAEVEE